MVSFWINFYFIILLQLFLAFLVVTLDFVRFPCGMKLIHEQSASSGLFGKKETL